MSNLLLTPTFRVSFPQSLFVPQTNQQGKPSYSVTMLFNKEDLKNDPQQKKLFDALEAEVNKVGTAKHGNKPFQSPFKDGPTKVNQHGRPYEGYDDSIIFAVAKTQRPPGIVDQSATKRITDPQDLYGGCYARAKVHAYAWTYMGKAGVSIGLDHLQKVKDGEPFSGRTDPEDEFDALSEDVADMEKGIAARNALG